MMKLKPSYTAIYLLFILSTGLSFAQEKIESEENFCIQLLEVKKQKFSFLKRISLLKEFWMMKHRPSKYSRPKYTLIKPKNLFEAEDYNVKKIRNIIFTVGPSILKQKEYENDPQTQERYRELKLLIKDQNKIIKKLFKTKSLKSCLKRKEKYHFNYKSYLKLRDEMSGISIPAQMKELKIVKKVIKKTLKKLNLKWEIKYFTNLNKVHDYLKKTKVTNIVIVSHGKRNGHLVDSGFNHYPLGFFSDISPSIFSINFFSCYSDETLKVYNISKKIGDAPSYYTERIITSVKGRKVETRGQVAPLKGLKSYLKKIDKKISKKIIDARVKNMKPFLQKTCHLKISGAKVLKGTLGLSLNRKFLGAINQESLKNDFSFPCDWIKQKNILIIKGINSRVKVDLNSDELDDIEIILKNFNYDFKIRHYKMPDGSFRSIIAQF